MSKDKFQERLDRLKALDGGSPGEPPKPAKPRLAQAAPRRASGWNCWMVAASVLAGCVVGGLGSGIYAFTNFLNTLEEPFEDWLIDSTFTVAARTPTMARFDGMLTAGPKERKQRPTGWLLPAPFVAAQGRSDLTLSEIAEPVELSENQPVVGATLVAFEVNAACTLRRPRADEVVRTVRLEHVARYTHMHMFSKAELAEAVNKRIEGIVKSPGNYKNAAHPGGRMGQVDVFVTDTSAPVYLSLQSEGRNVLWNIHLAKNVRLAHVAIIGENSAFAAPEGAYSFEAVRISDFVQDEDYGDQNREIRPCMVRPWRQAKADWPILQELDHPHDGSTYKDLLRYKSEGFRAFNHWYMSQTGVDADVNLTTAISATYALVGPVPDELIVQQPVSARKLHVAQADYVVIGDSALEKQHADLLAMITGGDLSILNPAPMEGLLQ